MQKFIATSVAILLSACSQLPANLHTAAPDDEFSSTTEPSIVNKNISTPDNQTLQNTNLFGITAQNPAIAVSFDATTNVPINRFFISYKTKSGTVWLAASRGESAHYTLAGSHEDPIVSVSFTGGTNSTSNVEIAVPGQYTAKRLNARYADTATSCTGNKPSYYCNGVIIRSVDNGDFNPWDPSPNAEALGAVSFSYLRRDAHVDSLYNKSGFIFLPQAENTAWYNGITYLCMYAYDAGTNVGERPNKGCGLKPRDAVNADLSTCASKNATTVAGWYAFTKTINSRDYQCSLSTESAEQFAVSLQVRAQRPPNMESIWNELMVGVWPQGHAQYLPIEAFFFKVGDNTSFADAKVFQTKFKNATGKWVPVIGLDFSKANGSPFSYNIGDQAIRPSL